MDRKLDLKVGQEVVVRIIVGSNASRREKMTLDNIDNWCFAGEVTKIGRKYITAKFNNWQEYQFEIESDYRNKYTYGGADYQLYLSKDEVVKEMEAEELFSELRNHFGGWGKNANKFSLNQLQRIISIVNENKESK